MTTRFSIVVWRSLAGASPRIYKELDKTEQLSTVLGKPHRVQLSYSFQTS